MSKLANYWQNEVQAKYDQEQAELNEQHENTPKLEDDTIRLDMTAGKFTFNDGEKEITGQINSSEHGQKLYDRAVELAKEKKMKLTVTEGYSVLQPYCRDYR